MSPDGYVFDVTQGWGHTLPGVTVTAYVSYPQWGGWTPWPAYLYDDQINPQVTGEDGYFAFFTPPGQYYLQVEGIPGYQEWRSPVVEVITEIVHVNVPYTPWPAPEFSGSSTAGDRGEGGLYAITLTADGPDPAVITIPVGSAVEWTSALRAADTIFELIAWTENPILRLLSGLDPIDDTRGWDAGLLAPGRVYRREFAWPGTYIYTDGAGHSGQVIVTGEAPYTSVYLPLVVRQAP